MKKKRFWIWPVLLGLVLAWQVLMHPQVVEYMLKKIIRSSSSAELSLRVERFSLLYGFRIHEIRLAESATQRPLL
ncbi:MAG: hypothetical protein KDK39_18455, partial [Leptospiraceae bacterium]|nr:hypothetical protein [Leptospiraceae bacterium]